MIPLRNEIFFLRLQKKLWLTTHVKLKERNTNLDSRIERKFTKVRHLHLRLNYIYRFIKSEQQT